MTKKRAFLSFDSKNDIKIQKVFVGESQEPDSLFEVVEMSNDETMDHDWEDNTRERIKSCDVFIVLCGYKTDSAESVSAELSIAQQENIPYFFLWGRKNGVVSKPRAALSTDKVYGWNKGAIRLLLAGKR